MEMNFYNPVRIESGADVLANYRGFADYGRKCLIVCGGSSARKCGALADAESALSACGVEYLIYDKIEPNPLAETCHAAGAAAVAFGAEFILGIGGGSPLDAAKAAAVFAANPGLGAEDVYHDALHLSALPIICVPTTAGTGSEVTPYAIMTLRSKETKKSFWTEHSWPSLALLDPKYTLTLPDYFTASCAVDALSHAIEGYFSKKASLTSDILAEKAVSLIVPALLKMGKAPLTPEDRENLLFASTLAGLVISRTGTGFPHACGYPLTYFHNLPHGHANGCFLAAFLEIQREVSPEWVEKLLSLMGLTLPAFSELLRVVLPEPEPITPEEARRFAHSAAGTKNCAQSLRTVTEEDIFPLFSALVRG